MSQRSRAHLRFEVRSFIGLHSVYIMRLLLRAERLRIFPHEDIVGSGSLLKSAHLSGDRNNSSNHRGAGTEPGSVFFTAAAPTRFRTLGR